MKKNTIINKLLFRKHNKNVLSPFQTAMIHQIKKMSQKEAMDIMTPRVDVVSFHLGDSLDEILKTIRQHGFSRYPVWQDKIDDVLGILYVKDLLYYISSVKNSDNTSLVLDKSILRNPFFIPESKYVESLLSEFQSQKVHMAIVLDEYGGFSGIVTLEDIIELIVGDIQDEHDRELPDILKLSDHIYIVDGRTSLEELSEKFNIDYSEYTDDLDSLGGLIYSQFDRIPTVGERIEINNITYQVHKLEKNKIISIKIWFPQTPESK